MQSGVRIEGGLQWAIRPFFRCLATVYMHLRACSDLAVRLIGHEQLAFGVKIERVESRRLAAGGVNYQVFGQGCLVRATLHEMHPITGRVGKHNQIPEGDARRKSEAAER